MVPNFRKTFTPDLQTSIVSLDFRLAVLEVNGNHTEVRVETLEGTTADHEARISTAELDINGKDFFGQLSDIFREYRAIMIH